MDGADVVDFVGVGRTEVVDVLEPLGVGVRGSDVASCGDEGKVEWSVEVGLATEDEGTDVEEEESSNEDEDEDEEEEGEEEEEEDPGIEEEVPKDGEDELGRGEVINGLVVTIKLPPVEVSSVTGSEDVELA